MTLRPLFGHDDARTRILGAITRDRLPQSMLLVGAEGVGKQRLALWTAQVLLCQRAADGPCGGCRSCLNVERLTHPDLHWFVPVARPKASDLAKQAEEVDEALGEAMEARRAEGRWGPPEAMAGHFMATIRLLLSRLARTAAEGGRRVVILGDADRLIVQEASQEAANALLKVLEEPPAGTHLILTTADERRLLPTIRSRLALLRLRPLPPALVEQYLREHGGMSAGPALRSRAERAGGAIGRALQPDGDTKAAGRARDLLDSLGRSGSARWERLLATPAFQARGDFTELLDALAAELRDRMRQEGSAGRVARLVRALERVGETRQAAAGNVNPQLLLAALTGDLTEELG